MKLVLALGNPGPRFVDTRHNSGWLFLDYFAGQLELDEPWQEKTKFQASVARFGDWWLAKPTTFMNRAGVCAKKLVNFYQIKLEDLVVVHDDLDLKLGIWKLQQGVGPKIHNGLLSVEESLGEKNFWRLRLGIDNREGGQREISGEDYVLAKFPQEEKAKLEATFPEIEPQLRTMLD